METNTQRVKSRYIIYQRRENHNNRHTIKITLKWESRDYTEVYFKKKMCQKSMTRKKFVKVLILLI